MSPEQWATPDVAAYLKITPESVRRYRVRDASFPQPDGKLGSTPWWHPESIIAWHEGRPSSSWPARTQGGANRGEVSDAEVQTRSENPGPKRREAPANDDRGDR